MISFRGYNLVVVGSQAHPKRRPGVEVVSGGNGTAGTLGSANGPVLVEGSGSRNGRLVDLLVGVDVVDRSVTGDSSLEGHAAAGVVFTVALHDVVLDKGAGGPTVHSKVRIARGAERSREVDVSLIACVSVWAIVSTSNGLTWQNQWPSPCRR